DCYALSDQAGYISQGTPELATKGVEESFLLLRRCFVINVEYRPPVTLQDIAGNLIDLDKREVGDIHAPHVAAINVIGIDRVAAAGASSRQQAIGTLANTSVPEKHSFSIVETIEILREEWRAGCRNMRRNTQILSGVLPA